MFWRFGGYANISTIDTILDKPDVTLEEVLDESDLIQELKQHNSKLIEYLRDETVLSRLLQYVIAPAEEVPEDEDDEWEDTDEEEDGDEEEDSGKKSLSPFRNMGMGRKKEEKSEKEQEKEDRENKEKTRQKYAYVASEVLSSETWSIVESMMEHHADLRKFWEFVRRQAPLDPVTAGYFTKINETLLDKKTEEMLDFIKSLEGIIPSMLQHVDCPMIMDLLLKIISMEKAEGGQGVVDWLHSQNLMPSLLAYLGEEHPTFTQTSAGDFIKAIITISANASQNEQSCIGPNSLTRQLVSEKCIEGMIKDMLKGGNPLTVGVGIIIEVIRKNNSDYDPEITMGNELPPTTSDPIYLGTLLRLFAKHVPDFTSLILSPTHTVNKADDKTVTEKRKDLQVAFGNSIEPLGFDRFKTCELMAELLHCSNMGLLNERGSEDYIRQRDRERERLKAEGALSKPIEPQSAVTEFSDGSSFIGGEKSPAETRKLEVTNSTDDDGFEDVGASAEIKEIKGGESIKRSKSRVSLDDEFVDEPLSSPKADQAAGSPRTERKPEPPSPTTALSSGVKNVQINESKQSQAEVSKNSSSATDDLVNEIEAQLSPTKTGPDAPPLPKRENLSVANGSEPSDAVSPNEEDRPAPLFSSRQEEQPQTQVQPPPQGLESAEATQEMSQDTAQGMPFIHRIENDVDGTPIVGDYLKMQFVEHKVVPTILDFFFRFPWNNFLHNVVYDVVQQVFNGPMDRGFNRNLAFDLFMTGRITERIIQGQSKSDEVTAEKGMRLGYMGHLTLVAEEVVKFSERHPPEVLSEPVLEFLTSKGWGDYVENTLSETRDRDNAILGGVRPDMAVGPRQAVLNAVNAATGFGNTGSNALVNAGLNGGTGLDSMELSNTGQSNFLSGGSLLSGFGSSSDEEDEEMEEIHEQEEGGTEGSGSDQYPTYTPSSLSALSIFSNSSTDNQSAQPLSDSSNNIPPEPSNPPPSIPPPLNIPPSRARRQLQARLALSKEKAEREAAASAAATSDDKSEDVNVALAGAGKLEEERQETAAETLDRLLRTAKAGGAEELAVSEALRRADEDGRRRLALLGQSGEGGMSIGDPWMVRGLGEGGAPSAPAPNIGTGGGGGAVGGLGAAFSPTKPTGLGGWDGSSDEDDTDDTDEDASGEEASGKSRFTPESSSGAEEPGKLEVGGKKLASKDSEDEGEGEDVPLSISTSPRTAGPPGVVGRMRALFASGGATTSAESSENGSPERDGEGSSADEADGGRRGKA